MARYEVEVTFVLLDDPKAGVFDREVVVVEASGDNDAALKAFYLADAVVGARRLRYNESLRSGGKFGEVMGVELLFLDFPLDRADYAC